MISECRFSISELFDFRFLISKCGQIREERNPKSKIRIPKSRKSLLITIKPQIRPETQANFAGKFVAQFWE